MALVRALVKDHLNRPDKKRFALFGASIVASKWCANDMRAHCLTQCEQTQVRAAMKIKHRPLDAISGWCDLNRAKACTVRIQFGRVCFFSFSFFFGHRNKSIVEVNDMLSSMHFPFAHHWPTAAGLTCALFSSANRCARMRDQLVMNKKNTHSKCRHSVCLSGGGLFTQLHNRLAMLLQRGCTNPLRSWHAARRFNLD